MSVSKIPSIIKKYNLHFISLFLIIICISLSNYFTNFKKKQNLDFQKFLENTYLNKTSLSLIQNLDPRFEKIIIKVKSGDSFQKILSQIEINKSEKNRILKEILKKNKLSNIVKDQKIIFKIDKRGYKKIIELLIEVSKTKSIIFTLNTNTNNFEYKEIQKSLKRNIAYKESTITNSLYDSSIKNGIQPNVIIDFARVYGFQVDFQRDIWKNDRFQIVYETFLDSNNTVLDTQPWKDTKDIITTITLNKRHINILQDITSSKYPKIFLSHAWGKDDHNRDNHLRIYQLNNLLKRHKCLTWFDETDLEGGIVQSMTSGIDWADLVIVCITRTYINKCKKQGNDNCKLEFEYSINRKSALRIIPLVMEESCKDQSTWDGPVGACCGQLLYIDCCWEIDNSIADTIYKRIVKKIQSIPKQNNDN